MWNVSYWSYRNNKQPLCNKGNRSRPCGSLWQVSIALCLTERFYYMCTAFIASRRKPRTWRKWRFGFPTLLNFESVVVYLFFVNLSDWRFVCEGNTPLGVAVLNGHPDYGIMLIQKEADVRIFPPQHSLYHAITNNNNNNVCVQRNKIVTNNLDFLVVCYRFAIQFILLCVRGKKIQILARYYLHIIAYACFGSISRLSVADQVSSLIHFICWLGKRGNNKP